jgi:hypothetical protein
MKIWPGVAANALGVLIFPSIPKLGKTMRPFLIENEYD